MRANAPRVEFERFNPELQRYIAGKMAGSGGPADETARGPAASPGRAARRGGAPSRPGASIEAAATWNALPVADRARWLGRAGENPLVRANAPRVAWERLAPAIRGRLTQALAPSSAAGEANGAARIAAASREAATHPAVEGMRRLWDMAKRKIVANHTVEIAPVDRQTLAEAKEKAGLDLNGYRHTADMFAVRHALNRHGDANREKSRGQIAIGETDIAFVPEAVTRPDAVVYGAKNERKQDLVASIKRMPDGSLLVAEEVRTGRKTLALASLRKYPAARDFSSIARTLLSNARSDGGNGLIIAERGKNGTETPETQQAKAQGRERQREAPAAESVTGGAAPAVPAPAVPARAGTSKPAAAVRPPSERRRDIVGAILRVTGGAGISSRMAETLTGEKANRPGRLRGLFTRRGQEDLDDLAMLLREEEGYDVRDASHLEDLIREAAAGNVAVSMRDAAEHRSAQAEKEYRERVRIAARRLNRRLPEGSRIRVNGVKFEALEKAVEAGNALRRDRVMRRIEERARRLGEKARQAYEAAIEWARGVMPEEAFESLIEDELSKIPMDDPVAYYRRATAIVEARILDHINGEANAARREESGRYERDHGIEGSEGEARPRGVHEPAAGRSQGDSGNDRRREVAGVAEGGEGQSFGLIGETNAQARENARRRAEQDNAATVTKAQADRERDAVAFTLDGGFAPAAQGAQSDLLTPDGRPTAAASSPRRDSIAPMRTPRATGDGKSAASSPVANSGEA
ncbi:MAG: hypothetical protein LBI87_14765, partial [Candidatus Accumulibacter sp.]|nr:hypothetical protein [Accumulibacter sp.]